MYAVADNAAQDVATATDAPSVGYRYTVNGEAYVV